MNRSWHLPTGQTLSLSVVENVLQISLAYKEGKTAEADYHYLTAEIDQTGELRLVLKVKGKTDAAD